LPCSIARLFPRKEKKKTSANWQKKKKKEAGFQAFSGVCQGFEGSKKYYRSSGGDFLRAEVLCGEPEGLALTNTARWKVRMKAYF